MTKLNALETMNLQEIREVSDEADSKKGHYDLKFYEFRELMKQYEERADLAEVVILAYNLGFFRGVQSVAPGQE